jgi:parvulin-like peptidyl-prolyl isomerase
MVTGAAPLAFAENAPPIESYAHLTGEDGKSVKVPLFDPASGTVAVAKVGEDAITVQDFAAALTSAHQKMTAADAKTGKKDPAVILNRLIEVRLLVQEARAMGIADLPEIKDAIAQYRDTALLEALRRDVLKDVRPDPKDVERVFQDATREWKIKSAYFPKLEDAKAVSDALAKGKSFDDLLKKAVADKKAQGGQPAEFLPRSKLLPEVVNVLERLKQGKVSTPIRLSQGYALVRYDAVRYPEDPKARAEATDLALKSAQKKALKKYYDQAVKKYAVIDEKLFRKVDYEAKKPGVAALRKDKRVLARIQGGKDITVADLTEKMEAELQHGLENAVKAKRANRLKLSMFDAVVAREVVPLAARRLGYEKTPAYQKAIDDYSTALLFTHFVDKAIVPDIKLTEQEQRSFYDQHKPDFTLSAFYKLEGIGFTNVKDAQSALAKLRSGTDLKFMLSNAENQVKDVVPELKLGGNTIAASTLPEDLQKQLEGARKGDYRLYTTQKGPTYVLHVLEVTPPEVEPFEQAREGIKQRLFAERVTVGVKDWAAKLRQARPVKVYLTKVGS